MMRIAGACHCGTLRFALDWPDDAASDPRARLRLHLLHQAWRGLDIASRREIAGQRFRTPRTGNGMRSAPGTADFHVCGRCGVPVAGYQPDRGTRLRGGERQCLRGLRCVPLDRSRSDFEGEAVGDRLARRQSRWIADVVFDTP
jgi:hypothetical protein